MFIPIKSSEDIKAFRDQTNNLHDGYVIDVRYTNGGILREGNRLWFHPEQTKLVIQILITSMFDVVVELEFEEILQWQIKDTEWDMTDNSVVIDENNWIIWSDDVYIDLDYVKERSYVIARSMKWRIVK